MTTWIAVFFWLWLLTLILSVGGAWMDAISYFDPGRPEGPPASHVFAAGGLAAASALLSLRISPVILGAAYGLQLGFGAIWRSLSGNFLRFLIVFVCLALPLHLGSKIAWLSIVLISVAIEEHSVFLLIPIMFSLDALALTLATATLLGVTARYLFPNAIALRDRL